jgi:protein kinase A
MRMSPSFHIFSGVGHSPPCWKTAYVVEALCQGVRIAVQVLPKAALVEAKQVEHAAAERRLLAAVDSPFCARLAAAFQDAHRLYLLLEWVPGAPRAF